MSDISKKIFSIDPDPDEDPIAIVPPLPDDTKPDAPDDILDLDTPDVDTPQRSRIQLRPVDELTDRDIVQSIRSSRPFAPITADHTEQSIASDPVHPVIDRPPATITPDPGPSPSLVAALAPRERTDDRYPASPKPGRAYGWIGFILTVLTAGCIGGLVYVMLAADSALTPMEMAIIAMAAIVPAATVGTLWAALRALSRVTQQADHLAVAAERLTHVDDRVAKDVASMSAAIRSELTHVDTHLSATRQHLLGVAEQAAVQGAELAQMTQSAADNAEAIDRAVTSHREQFRSLLSEFEIRLQSLAQSVERHATLLETAGMDSAARMETVTQSLSETINTVSDRGRDLSGHVESADQTLSAAEARLQAISDRVAERTTELTSAYDRRSQHLKDLSDRMTAETSRTDDALTHQIGQLEAIDTQIASTHDRLTAVLDHARGIQSQLASRLSDIDSTLSEADRRSRAFTADMSDRVNDLIAQTRRELSIMEGELRVLQSRMKDQSAMTLGLEDKQESLLEAPSARIHLQPLETDFPPLEPQSLDIPEEPTDDANESLLDLVEIVEVSPPADLSGRVTPADDVVRRPGLDASAKGPFGRPKRSDNSDSAKTGSWRWRDMLGGIDPLHEAPSNDAAAQPASIQPALPQQGVDRPPAGVPLSPPVTGLQSVNDGSDIVARLCEVQLAPSAVVDEGTIYEAAAVRRTGGEEAQNACVQARLDGPIAHLQRVLNEDLEFKLRAESFRRAYSDTLLSIHSDDALQAKLGSATGRAYLLCAAALIAA